jgi:hypothetical protein
MPLRIVRASEKDETMTPPTAAAPAKYECVAFAVRMNCARHPGERLAERPDTAIVGQGAANDVDDDVVVFRRQLAVDIRFFVKPERRGEEWRGAMQIGRRAERTRVAQLRRQERRQGSCY